MSGTYRDRVIALSALMQAVSLVQQVADTGHADTADFETLLKSLLIQDAPTTEAVFGSAIALRTGIQQLNQQLVKQKGPKDTLKLRYAIGLLHLEKKLAKRGDMLKLIGDELQNMPQHIDFFGSITSPQVIARFANIYERTISELSPRIQVLGESGHLQQPDNANKVRALLLAGIRAVVLWRQKGGRRWQFLLSGNKLLTQTANLLKEQQN